MTKSRGILPPRKPWTAEEDDAMRRLYPDTFTRDLARTLDRTEKAVHARAKVMGVRKSAEFLSGPMGHQLDGHRDNGRRFKVGHKPWCSGTKGVVGVQEGCRSTQFKKGRPACEARNYLPIGSLRINGDGYLERKLTDDPSIVPARRWVGVHRLVWVAERGEIPPDRAIVFKPGRRTTVEADITLDALELVTRRELMARNTVHNLPKELAQLVQLRGAVTRQINQRVKSDEQRPEDHQRPAGAPVRNSRRAA